MGRLRANRRAGETLTIYFISKFVLDMPVELVRAVDICLEAATPIQKLELAISRCVEELKAKNEKLTLTAIADFCKVSKQRLSQLVKELGYSTAAEFKKSLVLLLESHSKTRQNSNDYIPLSAEKQIDLWAAQIGSLPKSVIFALLEGASNTLAPPQPETKPLMPIAPWTGWVNRWGELHKARFKSWCENGTRWVVEYLENSGQLGETQVDPKNFVWAQGGASC
jgi:hypothetical protein